MATGIIVTIIVGAIVGWIAAAMMADRGQGVWGNIIVGIIGALVGGWLLGALFGVGNIFTDNTFNYYEVLWALIGSVVFVLVYAAIYSATTHSHA